MAGCAAEPTADTDDSRTVQAIVRTTNSPFCPGKTLDSCPSPKAAEWRADINQWVEADVPEAAIRERLQQRVPGFELKPQPVASGWLIPLVAVLVSTLWFVVMSRRLRRRTRLVERAPIDRHRSFDSRLDEELAQLE